MSPLLLRICCLAALLKACAGLGAAEATAMPAATPLRIGPLPALLGEAANRKIGLAKIEVPQPPVKSRTGDSLTTLISLRDGAKEKQWIATFRIAPPTEQEKAIKHSGSFMMTVNGHTHEFSTAATLVLDIRTLGPFSAGSKNPEAEKKARTLISPELLALGMDRFAAGAIERTRHKASNPETPPPMSPEFERTFAGMMPALISFFQAVQETPGLKEVLWDIVDLPSAWSILKRGGKFDPGFYIGEIDLANSAEWGLANLPCYRMELKLSLNDQPALHLWLFVTSPHPPLLISAGVVGIVALHPKKPGKRLDIRAVAAQPATD